MAAVMRKIRNTHHEIMNQKLKSTIREWVESIVIAGILALVIRTFVVAPFKIPTGSMRPTLMEGDRLFVNRFIYRFKEPERGDVIVFKYPVNKKKDFIKRLIAFEGEEVYIKNGDVYIDGELLEDPYIIKDNYYYSTGNYSRNGKKVKVPEGSLFVLGDNSSSSSDSRVWGFVPRKNLVGKAFFIFWPPKRIRIIK